MLSLPDIVRASKAKRTGWEGYVERLGESRNAYSVLVGKPEGKMTLGRPGLRVGDNIKMD
jgi:hypothetical protein